MRLNPTIFSAACFAVGTLCLSGQAFAGNAAIEKALKARSDISSFYEASKKMGVLDELKEGTTYTVFAPTNTAFARMTQDKYPCLYSNQCREEIADILRNHFVAEPVTFSGPVKGTVFSIDGMNINLTSDNMGVNGVAGYRIVNRGQVIGGTICQIDGVIAGPQELANVSQLKYVPVEVQRQVIEKTTTDKVFYAPDGTPDGVSRTTSFTSVPVSTSVEPASGK